MMYSDSDEDLESRNRKTVLEGREILERTGQSLARSEHVAIETENIGTQVVSDLSEQRETLLRAKSRLTNADEQLDSTRNILRRMGRNVLYNKLILILIIILEILILASLSYLKFKK
ncbi:vesicle transport through interaction with t-SNAREs homolog 1B [Agrilus planipennis]|uniref:Vesicle transport through interaction with t-SNAREs homolog 1B n=1 Tax=Agrilus planipennis TaxID=224129 RepID=A0A1W4WS17_AGRPL|nr:vesicle transport through interaction with t-SNAREs homolog 1B [Agrilus planipennis]